MATGFKTTTGHTGEDVVLYSYHPNSAYKLSGVVLNTDIAKYAEEVLGLDLAEATSRLFVPARAAFEARGAKVVWDDSDVENPVVIVTKGSEVLKLPINKDEANLNGKVINLEGITVFNGTKTYVSQQAVDLVK